MRPDTCPRVVRGQPSQQKPGGSRSGDGRIDTRAASGLSEPGSGVVRTDLHGRSPRPAVGLLSVSGSVAAAAWWQSPAAPPGVALTARPVRTDTHGIGVHGQALPHRNRPVPVWCGLASVDRPFTMVRANFRTDGPNRTRSGTRRAECPKTRCAESRDDRSVHSNPAPVPSDHSSSSIGSQTRSTSRACPGRGPSLRSDVLHCPPANRCPPGPRIGGSSTGRVGVSSGRGRARRRARGRACIVETRPVTVWHGCASGPHRLPWPRPRPPSDRTPAPVSCATDPATGSRLAVGPGTARAILRPVTGVCSPNLVRKKEVRVWPQTVSRDPRLVGFRPGRALTCRRQPTQPLRPQREWLWGRQEPLWGYILGSNCDFSEGSSVAGVHLRPLTVSLARSLDRYPTGHLPPCRARPTQPPETGWESVRRRRERYPGRERSVGARFRCGRGASPAPHRLPRTQPRPPSDRTPAPLSQATDPATGNRL